MKLRDLLILALVMLYIISPVDAIPDVIPVIGWLDDVAVLGLGIAAIARGR